jgi:hypothetical protein
LRPLKQKRNWQLANNHWQNLKLNPIMNKILTAFISAIILFTATAGAQQDPVLVSVAENVTRSEFKVFHKNNRDEKMDRKAVEDYLSIY